MRCCCGGSGAETTCRLSDHASLFQRRVSTILVDGLQRARGQLYGHELLQFRDPNPLVLQVRQKVARGRGGHVLTDAALLLGQTTAVNFPPAKGLGSSDVTDSAHKIKFLR